MTRKCAVMVRFKRAKSADWEYGIAVGADVSQIDTITDVRGEHVDGPVFDFQPQPFAGLMWFDLPTDTVRKSVREARFSKRGD